MKHLETIVHILVGGLVLIMILALPYCSDKKATEKKNLCRSQGGSEFVVLDRGIRVLCYDKDGKYIGEF